MELGVLKESSAEQYRLVKSQDEAGDVTAVPHQQVDVAMDEEPASVMSVEQQQAEQMKVFWKVSISTLCGNVYSRASMLVH